MELVMGNSASSKPWTYNTRLPHYLGSLIEIKVFEIPSLCVILFIIVFITIWSKYNEFIVYTSV